MFSLLLLIKVTVLLLSALAVTLVMPRASAGARHLVWLSALGALLVLPALAAWSPVRLAIIPAAAFAGTPDILAGRDAGRDASATPTATPTPAPAPTTGGLGAVAANRQAEPGTTAGSSGSAAASQASSATGRVGPATTNLTGATIPGASIGTGSALMLLWGAVALALAGWLGAGALAVRRIVRRAGPLDTGEWRAPLFEIADRLGIATPPRLLRSADITMPFACGFANATIVLPADCDQWSADRRHAVLLHELGHVRRRDLVGHTLGRLACALYWFHPLVWVAAKRLRAESERACDDLAITCGTRASDYAEHLLDIVSKVKGNATPAVALAMARRKEFEGRLLAILDPALVRTAPGRLQGAALMGGLGVLALAVSAAAPVRPSPDRDRIATPAPMAAPKVDGPSNPASTSSSSTTTRTVMEQRQTMRTSLRERSSLPDATKPESEKERDLVSMAAAPLRQGTQAGAKQAVTDERPALLANVLRTDSSAALRKIAAWGLSQYADTDVAADALAYAVGHDASSAVREMAAWALGEGDSNAKAMAALEEAVRRDADQSVRAIAAWSLGQIGDAGAADALAEALTSDNADVRMRAAWALGQIEPKRAPRALVAMLGDKSAEVRELTAWALFKIQDPTTAGALDSALTKEQNEDVERGEIMALASVGEQSVDAIKRLLESKKPGVRELAIKALAGESQHSWPWPWPEPRPQP